MALVSPPARPSLQRPSLRAAERRRAWRLLGPLHRAAVRASLRAIARAVGSGALLAALVHASDGLLSDATAETLPGAGHVASACTPLAKDTA